MTLEKTKKIKINKSQLQKQKQTQNVIVNVNAPKATRKRPIRKPPQLKPAPKTHFQSPIYMPPVVTYNQPPQDTSSILSNILKIINKPKPESNELEKAKPTEKEPAVPAPTIPSIFDVPQHRVLLADEVKSDPFNTKQTFINTPIFEAKQEQFQFKAPLLAEPKEPTIAQKIQIGQEKKFDAPTKQPWAEVETGGHFGFLGINTEQLKAHEEAGKEFTWASVSTPILVEEARPTSEEIDLGIVPQMAQEIVQEDRVESNEPPIAHILTEEKKEETLTALRAHTPSAIPEKIATKANTEQIQLKALTMGEEKPFVKSLFYSRPKRQEIPPLITVPYSKDQFNLTRAARVKAFEKPLLLTQEAEPIISKETNQSLSPEKEATRDEDKEAKALSKLSNMELAKIIEGLGAKVFYTKDKKGNPFPKENKTILRERIHKLINKI